MKMIKNADRGVRLIDADDLKKKTHPFPIEYAVTLREINDIPTIDPVHAAGGCYCMECDLWNDWDYVGRKELGNLVRSCAHWTMEDGLVVYTKPDDFCSYGEPKERE